MTTEGYKSTALRFPHFVVEGSAVVDIKEYVGRIAVFSKRADLETPGSTVYKLEFNIQCDLITGTYPDPIYAEVPDFIAKNSTNLFWILAPSSVSDATLLGYVEAMDPGP